MRDKFKRWNDRVGSREDGNFVFRCQRDHKELSRTFATYDEAASARAEHDVDVHPLHGHALRNDRKQDTLGEASRELLQYFASLIVRERRSDFTLVDYKSRSKALIDYFGPERQIDSITLPNIRKYMRDRLAKVKVANGREFRTSGSQVLKELLFLERLARETKSTLDWSVKRLRDELVDDVEVEQHRKKRAVPQEKIRAFIDHLEGDAKALVVMKALTALRNRELFNLKVGDVDFEAGLVRYVAMAKRKKKTALAPLAPELIPILQPLITGRKPEEWLFRTSTGRKCVSNSFRDAFKAAADAAGIPEVFGMEEGKQHGGVAWIRHSIVTALRPQIGIDAVSKFAGHASTQVTQTYYDLDTDALALKGVGVEAARSVLFSGAKIGPERV
jgi:integrase